MQSVRVAGQPPLMTPFAPPLNRRASGFSDNTGGGNG